MKLDFFLVISQLAGLFALIAAGYCAVKMGILKPESSASFSTLLLKITLPCTIFVSLIQKEYDPSFIRDGITIIIAGLVVFTSMLYASRYIAIFLRVPENCRGIWAFGAAFMNSGFMGFPIALALFGAEGLALAVMLNMAFNMTIYTLGAIEIARDNPNHESEGINMKSIIFSTINISTLVSLVFYFGRIPVPEIVMRPLTYLSNITTPLSMIIIGMALAHSKASDLLTDIHAWTCTAMRLIVYPVIICLLLKAFPLSSNPLVDAVMILVMAMPAASVTAVLCEIYHGNIDFAAKFIFLQNVFSMITIPIVCMMI